MSFYVCVCRTFTRLMPSYRCGCVFVYVDVSVYQHPSGCAHICVFKETNGNSTSSIQPQHKLPQLALMCALIGPPPHDHPFPHMYMHAHDAPTCQYNPPYLSPPAPTLPFLIRHMLQIALQIRIQQDIRRIVRNDARILNKLHRRVFMDKISLDDVKIYISFYCEASNRDAFMAIKQDLLLAFVDCVERNGARLAQPRTVLELDQETAASALPRLVAGLLPPPVVRTGGGAGGMPITVQVVDPLDSLDVMAVPVGNSNGSSSGSSGSGSGSGSSSSSKAAGGSSGTAKVDGTSTTTTTSSSSSSSKAGKTDGDGDGSSSSGGGSGSGSQPPPSSGSGSGSGSTSRMAEVVGGTVTQPTPQPAGVAAAAATAAAAGGGSAGRAWGSTISGQDAPSTDAAGASVQRKGEPYS
jgi:hypothetical protein